MVQFEDVPSSASSSSPHSLNYATRDLNSSAPLAPDPSHNYDDQELPPNARGAQARADTGSSRSLRPVQQDDVGAGSGSDRATRSVQWSASPAKQAELVDDTDSDSHCSVDGLEDFAFFSTMTPRPSVDMRRPPTPNQAKRAASRKNLTLGSFALGACILSFTCQTMVSRYIQNYVDYEKPYFILWVAHSLLFLLLPLHMLLERFAMSRRSFSSQWNEIMVGGAKLMKQHGHTLPGNTLYTDVDSYARVPTTRHRPSSVELASGEGRPLSLDRGSPPSRQRRSSSRQLVAKSSYRLILWHMFKWCTWFALLLNFGSYFWYVAVSFTTMSKASAIYDTSCFFAYLFSILMLKDRIMASKVMAVAISIAGVMLMIMVNRRDPEPLTPTTPQRPDIAKPLRLDAGQREFVGDMISVLCACLIGLYQVVYKKYGTLHDYHSLLFVDMMLALIGISTVVVFWLPLPILHWIHYEAFAWPSPSVLGFVLLNALFGVIYNGAFMVVLVLTSPLFASVGIMLTIPVIAAIDMVVGHQILAWNVMVGGASILLGFAVLTYVQVKESLSEKELLNSSHA
ncbi:hypothetical protein H4R34_004178 [Dimargaris verticillata]|uniref:EamA domain-containing protein n=1 Tax=Dimargaris verticillata TaxID=2761393 RepID=A0A9W8EBD7_9FUNG|nr:hypothetical protein H4R34_004178 [Dimargaris verticillata]